MRRTTELDADRCIDPHRRARVRTEQSRDGDERRGTNVIRRMRTELSLRFHVRERCVRFRMQPAVRRR